MFHREKNIEKNIERLFGEYAEDNYELREILKMSLTGKVDNDKLKELEDYRRKDLEFIYKNFELNQTLIISKDTVSNGESSTSKSD
jgi:hypothetical protein